jgi:hypothetical protein
MIPSEFLELGLFSSFHQKSDQKIFFDRFFDATMLDMTMLKTQSLRLYAGIQIFT